MSDLESSEDVGANWDRGADDPAAKSDWDLEQHAKFRQCAHEPRCQQYIEHWLCVEVQKVCQHQPLCRTFTQCRLEQEKRG